MDISDIFVPFLSCPLDDPTVNTFLTDKYYVSINGSFSVQIYLTTRPNHVGIQTFTFLSVSLCKGEVILCLFAALEFGEVDANLQRLPGFSINNVPPLGS